MGEVKMKTGITMIALCVALSASPLSTADANSDDPKADASSNGPTADVSSNAPEQAKAAKRTGMPKFKPTNEGTPMARLGGATRTIGSVARTEALVPEETGHTLEAQPVLYWYLSETTDDRIDFALIGVDPINPMLETTLEGPFKPGIQRVRTADLNAKLEAGVSYQWFIRVIPNPQQRLYDRIVGGGIERLEKSAELQAKLDAAQPGDTHYVLSEAGIWYDALDALSKQIESSPNDANLLAQRAALFEQVGLEKLN
jgi:hypothetical protein